MINNFSTRLAFSASTAEDFILSDQITLFTTAMDIIALFLIIRIINKIAKWETVLYNNYHEVNIEDHLVDLE